MRRQRPSKTKGVLGIKSEILRIIRLFWGLFLYSVGIVLTIHANIGLSPWDVFHQGVAKQLGITMGITNILVSAIIITVSALFRERIGFGTVCNMISIGIFIDILMLGGFIPVMSSFLPGVVMLIAGLFTIALATYFYVGAGYGAGPRDSLMIMLTKRTGRPVGLCRSVVEGSVLAIGWLLGGKAGIGTVISAFGMGFAIQAVFTPLRFNVREVKHESLPETIRRWRGIN